MALRDVKVRKNVLNTLYPIELIKDNNTRIVSKNSSNSIEVKNIENIQKNEVTNETLNSLGDMIFSYVPIKENYITTSNTVPIIEEEKKLINNLIKSVNKITEEIKNENKDKNEYEGENNDITLPIVSDNDNLLQYKFIKIKK
jgi:hypothetical protein